MKKLFTASKDNVDVIISSLKANDDALHVKDRDGDTLLHYAAMHGGINVVKALLSAGANVSAKDNIDETPLH